MWIFFIVKLHKDINKIPESLIERDKVVNNLHTLYIKCQAYGLSRGQHQADREGKV